MRIFVNEREHGIRVDSGPFEGFLVFRSCLDQLHQQFCLSLRKGIRYFLRKSGQDASVLFQNGFDELNVAVPLEIDEGNLADVTLIVFCLSEA